MVHSAVRWPSPIARPGISWPALFVAILLGFLISHGLGWLVFAVLGASLGGFILISYPVVGMLALITLLPFLPYIGEYGGLGIFAGLPLLVISSILVIVLANKKTRRQPEYDAALPTLAFTLLIAVMVISTLNSGHPLTGASRVLYLVAFGLVAFAIMRAVQTDSIRVRTLITCFVGGAAVAATAVIFQVMYGLASGRGPATAWLNSVFTTFAGRQGFDAVQQSNWYIPQLHIIRGIFPFMAAPSAGQYLMIALIGAVWLRREVRSSSHSKKWMFLPIVVITVALFLTFSRQAWVGALFGLVVLSTHHRSARMLFLAVALVVFAAVVSVPGTHETFANYLFSATETTTTSSATRIHLWSEAFHFINERPLLGIGPGQYSTLDTHVFISPVFYAHNNLLDFGVEAGVVGLFLVLLIFGQTLVRAFRLELGLPLAMLVAYLVANMFDDVTYFPRNGFLLAIIFGVAAVSRTRRSNVDDTAADDEGNVGTHPKTGVRVQPQVLFD